MLHLAKYFYSKDSLIAFISSENRNYQRLYKIYKYISSLLNKKKAILFVSCDTVYFNNYFHSIYQSTTQNSPDINIWVNIINPTVSEIRTVKAMKRKNKTHHKKCQLYYSLEYKDFSNPNHTEEQQKTYYASSRFIKLHRLLGLAKRDIIALDIDSIVLGDITRLQFEMHLTENDIAIKTRFHEDNVKAKFLAGTIYARHTKITKKFLLNFSKRIEEEIQKHRLDWFMDQVTLYETYLFLRREISLYHLPKKYLDWDFNRSAIIWTGKGDRKHTSWRYQAKQAEYAGNVKPKRVFIKKDKILNIGIFLPSDTKPKRSQIPKKRYSELFTEKILDLLKNRGHLTKLIITPFREINENSVNSYHFDLAFIPGSNYFEFTRANCQLIFYNQGYFNSLINCDHWGWGASNSMYPIEYSKGNEESDVFTQYQQKAHIESTQNPIEFNVAEFEYILFIKQNDKDPSLYFSKFNQERVINSVEKWAKQQSIPIIVTQFPTHYLISCCKAVYTMNSNIGCLSMFYYKPIVTFGKSIYDAVTIHGDLDNLNSVWQKVMQDDGTVRLKKYKKFIDWYCRVHCFDLEQNDKQAIDKALALFIDHLHTEDEQ